MVSSDQRQFVTIDKQMEELCIHLVSKMRAFGKRIHLVWRRANTMDMYRVTGRREKDQRSGNLEGSSRYEAGTRNNFSLISSLNWNLWKVTLADIVGRRGISANEKI